MVFDLVLQERVRRVRARPRTDLDARLEWVELREGRELSGSFDIELSELEDATTGLPLGWPSVPLVLHGSFDRLPLDAEARPR